MDVSHSISAELSIEFELQAGAEKARSLPVTVVVAGVNASPAERGAAAFGGPPRVYFYSRAAIWTAAAQKARMEIGFLKVCVIRFASQHSVVSPRADAISRPLRSSLLLSPYT